MFLEARLGYPGWPCPLGWGKELNPRCCLYKCSFGISTQKYLVHVSPGLIYVFNGGLFSLFREALISELLRYLQFLSSDRLLDQREHTLVRF